MTDIITINLTIIARDPETLRRLQVAHRNGYGVSFTRDDFVPDFHVQGLTVGERKGVTAAELLQLPAHRHEAWQLQNSARGGRYCAACGDQVPEQDNEDDFTNPNGV